MADQWLFKSETYDNCNCAVNCGCQFNLPSTHGYCQSAFVGNIVEGYFNDTPVGRKNSIGTMLSPLIRCDANHVHTALRDFCGSKSCIVMHSTAIKSVNAS